MDPFSDIKLEAASLGRDLLVTITGGEVHIGAASTDYWTVSGSFWRSSTGGQPLSFTARLPLLWGFTMII